VDFVLNLKRKLAAKKRKLLAVIGLIIVLIIVSIYGVTCVHKQLSSGNDFPLYYHAAKEMIRGNFHYELDTGLHGYVYLPFFAIALSPLTLLPLKTAIIIWYIINVFLWASSIYLGARIHNHLFSGKKRPWPLIIALLFTGQFFLFNLDLGQTNLVILALTLLALDYFFNAQRKFFPGIFIALASAIKPFAALLLLPFLLRGYWRLLLGFISGLFFCIVLLPGIILGPSQTQALTAGWYAKIIVPQQKGSLQGSKIIDQSPSAALRRLVVDAPAFADKKVNIFSFSNRQFLLANRIIQVFLLGAILLCWGVGRQRKSQVSLLIDLAVGYCGMVLVFGFNLKAQFVVLFLPWLLLITLTSYAPPLKYPPFRITGLMLFLAGLVTFIANPGLIGRAASNWALAYSAITLGTLLTTGVLVSLQFRWRPEVSVLEKKVVSQISNSKDYKLGRKKQSY